MKKKIEEEIRKEFDKRLEPLIQRIIETEREARRERLLHLKAMAKIRRKRGRPKNPIPDCDVLTEKEKEALSYTDIYHLKEKLEAYRRLWEKCNFNYSTMKEWLDKYLPYASYDRKILRKFVKEGELMTNAIDEILEKYADNPYISQQELGELIYRYFVKKLNRAMKGYSPKTIDNQEEYNEK